MTRGKGKGTKEILSRSEEDLLRAEQHDLQGALKDTEFGIGTAAEQIDKDKIKKQIQGIDRAIAERQAPRLKGSEKDAMAKEAEEIEAELREGMPTKHEMDHPGSNPGAVRKHMSWDKRNSDKIERYRYIQKCLNPDDPRSVENLRRDR
jgi:hypothetical protein